DALAVLGLEAGASQEAIKKAYRRLAALHHPDKGGDADEFVKISNAYEFLT
ncbi:DnaJ domain-containing protein, partial [Pelagophyceae sp. CCMP2097]